MWVSNSTFGPFSPPCHTRMNDGHAGHNRSKEARAAMPDWKPVPLLVSTLDMKPLRFWENQRRIVFLSKLSTFLTWDLGTWTKNPVWDLPSICQETSSGGRSKLLSAMPPTLVFHLSVSHRQPLKLNAGWNSLVRLANARFKKQKKVFPYQQAFIWHDNSKNLPSNSSTSLQWMSHQAPSNKYCLWFLWHTCFAVKLWRQWSLGWLTPSYSIKHTFLHSDFTSHRPHMPNLILKQLLLGILERAWEENQSCNENLNYVAATAAP